MDDNLPIKNWAGTDAVESGVGCARLLSYRPLHFGDQLFVDTGKRQTVWVRSTDKDDWFVYARGYREAAELLVPAAENDMRAGQFFLNPTLFLYRHYLELMLKQLLLMGHTIVGTEPTMLKTHNLEALWSAVRPFLADEADDDPPDELLAVESCIKELVAHEGKPDSYRYPMASGGDYWVRNQQLFDLQHFREVMGSVGDLLEGALTGLYEQWQQEHEWRHEQWTMAGQYEDWSEATADW